MELWAEALALAKYVLVCFANNSVLKCASFSEKQNKILQQVMFFFIGCFFVGHSSSLQILVWRK